MRITGFARIFPQHTTRGFAQMVKWPYQEAANGSVLVATLPCLPIFYRGHRDPPMQICTIPFVHTCVYPRRRQLVIAVAGG